MILFNTWVVFSSHHKKRLNLVLNTGIDVVFKIEGSKRFVYESILYPVVVVCRKKFTYFCPRLSLGFLENKLKLKWVCITSADGPMPSILLGSMSLCYHILGLEKVIFKLNLYFVVKYCNVSIFVMF